MKWMIQPLSGLMGFVQLILNKIAFSQKRLVLLHGLNSCLQRIMSQRVQFRIIQFLLHFMGTLRRQQVAVQ